MNNYHEEIAQLCAYGLQHNFIHQDDCVYIKNKLASFLHVETIDDVTVREQDISTILNQICTKQIADNLLQDTQVSKEIFKAKLMDIMLPRPHEIRSHFAELKQTSSLLASDYYYALSVASNYIQVEQIKKDVRWITKTNYGELDITINCSKPEKDPKDIAANLKKVSNGYPKCLLCKENEGYEGHGNHPARSNHRIIPVTLDNQQYFLQYSPYAYYDEHCIVFHEQHIPMVIDHHTFVSLLDFVEQFPHYFLGSNTDIPIVGGSILTHDHFQGGRHHFAMNKASMLEEIQHKKYTSIRYGRVDWPMSTIRLCGKNKVEIAAFANVILQQWKTYNDEENDIIAYTNEERHNAITPIARYENGEYILDLVLRNNRCNEMYPDGIFHPHKQYHHIKKENIGLIEVMGLAILPPRLLKAMEYLKQALQNKQMELAQEYEIFQKWYEIRLLKNYQATQDIDEFLKNEIGYVFEVVLENAGVFKHNEKGKKGFESFLISLED